MECIIKNTGKRRDISLAYTDPTPQHNSHSGVPPSTSLLGTGKGASRGQLREQCLFQFWTDPFFLSLFNASNWLILFYCPTFFGQSFHQSWLIFSVRNFPKLRFKLFSCYRLYSTAYNNMACFKFTLHAGDLKDHYSFHHWWELNNFRAKCYLKVSFLITQNKSYFRISFYQTHPPFTFIVEQFQTRWWGHLKKKKLQNYKLEEFIYFTNVSTVRFT